MYMKINVYQFNEIVFIVHKSKRNNNNKKIE